MAVQETNPKIPRSRENDYTPEAAAGRREFLRERTGVEFEHVAEWSFDPGIDRETSRTSSAPPRSHSGSRVRCS